MHAKWYSYTSSLLWDSPCAEHFISIILFILFSDPMSWQKPETLRNYVTCLKLYYFSGTV